MNHFLIGVVSKLQSCAQTYFYNALARITQFVCTNHCSYETISKNNDLILKYTLILINTLFQILCNRSSFSKYFCGHENGRLWFLCLQCVTDLDCGLLFWLDNSSKKSSHDHTGSHLSVAIIISLYSSYNYNQYMYIKKSKIKKIPVYKLSVCLLHVLYMNPKFNITKNSKIGVVVHIK